MSDGCGPSLPDAFAHYDPDTSSWRTSQLSLLTVEPSEPSSVTWPKQGMTLAGRAYVLRMSERPIAESASSLLLTPTVEDASRKGSQEWADRWQAGETPPECHQRLRTQVKMLLPTPVREPSTGNGHARNLGKEVALLPTPVAQDDQKQPAAHLAKKVASGAGEVITSLTVMMRQTATTGQVANRLLPTPRAQNGERRNDTVYERPLEQPQNLENALARVLPGATTNSPFTAGSSSTAPPPLPLTTEDD